MENQLEMAMEDLDKILAGARLKYEIEDADFQELREGILAVVEAAEGGAPAQNEAGAPEMGAPVPPTAGAEDELTGALGGR